MKEYKVDETVVLLVLFISIILGVIIYFFYSIAIIFIEPSNLFEKSIQIIVFIVVFILAVFYILYLLSRITPIKIVLDYENKTVFFYDLLNKKSEFEMKRIKMTELKGLGHNSYTFVCLTDKKRKWMYFDDFYTYCHIHEIVEIINITK